MGARADAARPTTSPASGRPTATTTTATRGASSATGATDAPAGSRGGRRPSRDVVAETPRARTLVLDVPGWPGHRAGQHVDVRLTAEDGYQAQRSYSIASAPEARRARADGRARRRRRGLAVPRRGAARRATSFEVRGPIGGYFTWSVDDGGPLLLVGGGSGLVPLMSMLRHRAAHGQRRRGARAGLRAQRRATRCTATSSTALEPRAGLPSHGRSRARRRRAGPASRAGSTRRCSPRSAPAPARRPRDASSAGRRRSSSASPTCWSTPGHDPAPIHAERFGPTGG